MKRAMALLGAVAVLALPHPGIAQDQPTVGLYLTKQTPFATSDQPLRIGVAARNGEEEPLENLTLTVAVYSPVRSRSEYAEFLEAGSTSLVMAGTYPIKGRVGPGRLRRFPTIEVDLTDVAAIGESALHPVTVELRSGQEFLALLRSVLVFVVERPLPLLVSTTFVLDAPVRARPDGTFVDDALEQQIVPDGRLDAIVGALESVPGVPVTLAMSPLLLEQLQGMRDGYRISRTEGVEEVPADAPGSVSAGRLLDRIREVARRPEVELLALPYASPSVPALVHAGLEGDLARQIQRGRATVAGLLGKEPVSDVFRPPGSAVTASSLPSLAAALSGAGPVPALLVDGDVLPPPLPDPLTPPATADVEADGVTMRAIASDPGVEARAAALPDDPILRAQLTLGELSAIHFEEPGVSRGVAVVFGEQDAPQAGFLRTFLRGIRGAPEIAWLKGITASRLLGDDQPAPRARRLAPNVRPSPLPGGFTTELADSREAVDAYASMAEQPDIVSHLDRLLLLSESRYLAGRQDLRLAYVDAARAAVRSEFEKVQLPSPSFITLTSQTGRIPVTLRNDAGYPVELVLTLRASGLELIGGPTRDITLTRPLQTFVFPAQAQRTGRFPVRLSLGTPDGTQIAEVEIVVRSTAYNRVALIITIGAALFLAAWWGRRFLSRTKRT